MVGNHFVNNKSQLSLKNTPTILLSPYFFQLLPSRSFKWASWIPVIGKMQDDFSLFLIYNLYFIEYNLCPQSKVYGEICRDLSQSWICATGCCTNSMVSSLKDISKPIGVSEYKVTGSLPDALEEQLPSVEDIQKRIK